MRWHSTKVRPAQDENVAILSAFAQDGLPVHKEYKDEFQRFDKVRRGKLTEQPAAHILPSATEYVQEITRDNKPVARSAHGVIRKNWD